MGVQARTNITQALGGLALIATLAITAYQANESRRAADRTQDNADANFLLATRGQISERFSRAVEQLGATNTNGTAAIDVRAGALFSLMRIGLDANEHTQPAFLVAATYVRNNYRPPAHPRPHGCERFDVPTADIATALRFVLPRVGEKLLEDTGQRLLLGLRGTNLNSLAVDELELRRFDLTGSRFREASLDEADFSGSTLASATFRRACLHRASFREAVLVGADFQGANLRDADFAGANLKRAKFTKAAFDPSSLSEQQKRDVILVAP